MPGRTLPPNHSRQIGGTIARVERVERRTVPNPNGDAIRQIFSYPGPMSALVESPPWYVPRSGMIDSVRVSLTDPATGTTTISLQINGSEAQQFSITTGNQSVLTPTALSLQLGSYITVVTVAVADSNMAVEVRLR